MQLQTNPQNALLAVLGVALLFAIVLRAAYVTKNVYLALLSIVLFFVLIILIMVIILSSI